MESDSKAPALRLLKVVVQPVMVLDDGKSLQEVPVDPIVVSAAEWPTYASGRFREQMKELQKQLETAAPQAESDLLKTEE
jgi:hypothetical protein